MGQRRGRRRPRRATACHRVTTRLPETPGQESGRGLSSTAPRARMGWAAVSRALCGVPTRCRRLARAARVTACHWRSVGANCTVPATQSLNSMTVRDVRLLAEQLASDALNEHWSPDLAVPVDPVHVARSMGVEVFSADLDADVFGMIRGDQEGAEIYVERSQPANRYRFTVAHECGHYVEHAQVDPSGQVAYIDRRSDPGGYDPSETFANHFAGALLMPKGVVGPWVRTGRDDFALADIFGVSLQAWRLRREHLQV